MIRRAVGIALAVVIGMPLAARVAAQTKEITGDKVTITATVEAIDHAKRVVTLKGPKGNYVDVDVPADVKRFDEIKVGDTLTATYYENLVLRLQKPGEPSKDTASAGVTRSQGAKPGATASTQRTITAVID